MASESIRRIAEEMIRHGWRLSSDYIERILPEKNFPSSKACMEELLSLDLRRKPPNNIIEPFFPDNINTADCELQGPVVLQISSVANVAQPLRRQLEDIRPRMLLIKLSDGVLKASAVEIESVTGIKANCPPGTKVKLTGKILVRKGKILLNSSNFQYLGKYYFSPSVYF